MGPGFCPVPMPANYGYLWHSKQFEQEVLNELKNDSTPT